KCGKTAWDRLSEKEAKDGCGFMEHAISENVLAGNPMTRRASYHFGNVVSTGPAGQIGSGLGKTTPAGTVSVVPPNQIVSETGAKLTVDGIDIEFQMAHGAEAPSEMMFYFPQFKALCLAETANHTLHNTYTLRGARVRDVLAWTRYLNESLQLFGDRSELYFGSHHWPGWGKEAVQSHLRNQRDAYRFIHDETLRLANHGYGPREIANQIKMPDAIG
ncbi:MAG: MBL fold metallo-hydrolase, partial [Mangrovicoccus sp.]|nr:MBL fold metallo-hydrolase [Mangrovicoccus sp.]